MDTYSTRKILIWLKPIDVTIYAHLRLLSKWQMIVQIFHAATAKSFLDSDLTVKRKVLEIKWFTGQHKVWILLLCAFQTGPKPVSAYCTQTPGAVTRSGFLPSCQACTTAWMNSARSCLEPMPLSAMTWRYNILVFEMSHINQEIHWYLENVRVELLWKGQGDIYWHGNKNELLSENMYPFTIHGESREGIL